jgi:hypothetical protein
MVDQVQSDYMEPRHESVREIKKSLKNAEGWFKVLTRYCEHLKTPLCHIPLNIHPETGPIICELKNCPLKNCPLVK